MQSQGRAPVALIARRALSPPQKFINLCTDLFLCLTFRIFLMNDRGSFIGSIFLTMVLAASTLAGQASAQSSKARPAPTTQQQPQLLSWITVKDKDDDTNLACHDDFKVGAYQKPYPNRNSLINRFELLGNGQVRQITWFLNGDYYVESIYTLPDPQDKDKDKKDNAAFVAPPQTMVDFRHDSPATIFLVEHLELSVLTAAQCLAIRRLFEERPSVSHIVRYAEPNWVKPRANMKPAQSLQDVTSEIEKFPKK